MTNEARSLSERVSSSYKELQTVAHDLNLVSDELGKSIAEIDEGLRKLNLGITTWVPIYKGDDTLENPQDPSFWSEDIGYAKIGNKWGICLRRVTGSYAHPDEETETTWVFNDAARALRLAAIDKIPELLEKLTKEASDTTEKLRAKIKDVKAVAAAVQPPNVTGFTIRQTR